jgi:hypothetical protein
MFVLKRFLLLLVMLVVTGVVFTGAASAATTASDAFFIENAKDVVQTGVSSLDVTPIQDMSSLVAAPGNSFFEQNGQVFYKTPTNIYPVAIDGADHVAVCGIRVDIYTSNGTHIRIDVEGPAKVDIEIRNDRIVVTITPL